jgi:hypothetical protein
MDFEETKTYSALKEDFDTPLRAPALPPLENLHVEHQGIAGAISR